MEEDLVFHWECHTYIGDHLMPCSWSTWPEVPITREQANKMLQSTKSLVQSAPTDDSVHQKK